MIKVSKCKLTLNDCLKLFKENQNSDHIFSKLFIEKYKALDRVESLYNNSNKDEYLEFIFLAFRAACVNAKEETIKKIIKSNEIKDLVSSLEIDISTKNKEKRDRLEEIFYHVDSYYTKCKLFKLIINNSYIYSGIKTQISMSLIKSIVSDFDLTFMQKRYLLKNLFLPEINTFSIKQYLNNYGCKEINEVFLKICEECLQSFTDENKLKIFNLLAFSDVSVNYKSLDTQLSAIHILFNIKKRDDRMFLINSLLALGAFPFLADKLSLNILDKCCANALTTSSEKKVDMALEYNDEFNNYCKKIFIEQAKLNNFTKKEVFDNLNNIFPKILIVNEEFEKLCKNLFRNFIINKLYTSALTFLRVNFIEQAEQKDVQRADRTFSLRYPHLLVEMLKISQQKKIKNVLLIGPGGIQFSDDTAYKPELLILNSLLPSSAKLIILEPEPFLYKALPYIPKNFGLVLKAIATINSLQFEVKEDNELFKEALAKIDLYVKSKQYFKIANSVSLQQKLPKYYAERTLAGFSPKFSDSMFKIKFDVIIALKSILYSLESSTPNQKMSFSLMLSDLLKKDGVLIIDQFTYKHLNENQELQNIFEHLFGEKKQLSLNYPKATKEDFNNFVEDLDSERKLELKDTWNKTKENVVNDFLQMQKQNLVFYKNFGLNGDGFQKIIEDDKFFDEEMKKEEPFKDCKKNISGQCGDIWVIKNKAF